MRSGWPTSQPQLPPHRKDAVHAPLTQDIHIPDDVLTQLLNSLTELERRSQTDKKEQMERLQQRLASVRHRIDQAYMDKLDGKIAEDFWQRKTADQLLTAKKTLELSE